MNAPIELSTGRFSLLIAPGRALERLLDPLARLAVQGPLRVLDGGNGFNVYKVAQHLRRYTADLSAALENIQVARAFTCYQMVALLDSTPGSYVPTLVLDLLSTFTDENVPFIERRRLLAASLFALRRLSLHAPLGVSARLAEPSQSEYRLLLAALEEAADQVWRFEAPAPPPPIRLF